MGTPNNNGLSKNKCIPEKGGQSSICCAESGNGQIKTSLFFLMVQVFLTKNPFCLTSLTYG